ncbi:hypothetical protein WJX73_010071 [Symbiochloris irregularis]|uniref:Exonuclease domain-containing protein n=1 Tax=Symbiochloris irregularis TaxID=706552 RepID=A0AAW1PIW5_9CHLO
MSRFQVLGDLPNTESTLSAATEIISRLVCTSAEKPSTSNREELVENGTDSNTASRSEAAPASHEQNGRVQHGAQNGPEQHPDWMPQAIVWIDLEMSGLDPLKDLILQIACLVTDGNLERSVQGPELAIHQSDEVLTGMNQWCVRHHGRSGLTKACRESTIDEAAAEEQVLTFIQQYSGKPATLAGHSVYVDLAFMKVHMPRLAAYFSHRLIDVSSMSELAKRWFPRQARAKSSTRRKGSHTAMADVKASLADMRYYQQYIFKPSTQ